MDINNSCLLSLTTRKNKNTEYGALNTADVKVSVSNAVSKLKQYDTVNISRKNIDSDCISDYVYEYETTMSNVANLNNTIITNCKDVSDKELIELYNSSPNKLNLRKDEETGENTNAPEKLSITGYDNKLHLTSPIDGIPPRKLHIVRTEDQEDTGGTEAPETPAEQDVPSEQEETTIPTTVDYTVSWGEDISFEVGTDEKIVKLTGAPDEKDYYYKISSESGSNKDVVLKYLENGRLLIEADDITVTAYEKQADNIILMGNRNTINTNSGSDIVRVGVVLDSDLYWDYWYDSEDEAYYLNTFNNNIINTGDGYDYVQNAGANIIDTGADQDYLYDYNDYITSYVEEGHPNYQYKNAEKVFGNDNKSDTRLGWAMQGGYGDCKFLSFLKYLIRES